MTREGLFQLDVDDDIWQDTGLDDDISMAAPQWLVDKNIQSGIQLLLEIDRCTEKEEWMMTEWEAVERAKQGADKNTMFQLQSRAHNLSLL
ncbi:hypothetical protein BJ138DRAFT_1118327 [Hygrophoropsis aurantiaca]|uniref:Uncharacterized protein n=1 Tax=Hygrophoropsis aurantiaca TaxID=72124 RepID=A0ACB7ZX38_9AGAM|nr:hypothetical protein BJ138DRAFT_1118327 [Hygrophoropsis aurantiaca]